KRRRGRHVVLARYAHADALAVEAQPVIAALDLLADHAAERQWSEPMRAAVGKRHRLAGGGAEQDDLLVADGAGKRRCPDLVCEGDHLPAISHPHGVLQGIAGSVAHHVSRANEVRPGTQGEQHGSLSLDAVECGAWVPALRSRQGASKTRVNALKALAWPGHEGVATLCAAYGVRHGAHGRNALAGGGTLSRPSQRRRAGS